MGRSRGGPRGGPRADAGGEGEDLAAAKGEGPVANPELPPSLTLTTAEQYKAIADPLRVRILDVIQHQPATAKQIADRLGKAPGTIGYQLRVLEAAGLARIVARRLVNGIVAKYYARTARIFLADFPHDIVAADRAELTRLRRAYGELAEALSGPPAEGVGAPAGARVLGIEFFHVRLAPARAGAYRERLAALLDEMAAEPPDPEGAVYGVCSALFVAPPHLQAHGPEDEARAREAHARDVEPGAE